MAKRSRAPSPQSLTSKSSRPKIRRTAKPNQPGTDQLGGDESLLFFPEGSVGEHRPDRRKSAPRATKSTPAKAQSSQTVVITDDEDENHSKKRGVEPTSTPAKESNKPILSGIEEYTTPPPLSPNKSAQTFRGRARSTFTTHSYISSHHPPRSPLPAATNYHPPTVESDPDLTPPPAKKRLFQTKADMPNKQNPTQVHKRPKDKQAHNQAKPIPTSPTSTPPPTKPLQSRSTTKQAKSFFRSALTSRIKNYTSLLSHIDQTVRGQKQSEDEISSANETQNDIEEEAEPLLDMVFDLIGVNAESDEDDETPTQSKDDIYAVMQAIEEWEKLEDRKALVRKKVMAETLEERMEEALRES